MASSYILNRFSILKFKLGIEDLHLCRHLRNCLFGCTVFCGDRDWDLERTEKTKNDD